MDHAAKQRLQEQMVKERVDVIISTPEEITEMSKHASPENQASWREAISFGLTYWGSGGDAINIAKIVNDVGGFTNALDIRVQHYGGKPYIIFKGNPRLRTIFTGTRYGIRNKKVMRVALGRLGAQASVIKAGIITVIFTTGFRIAEFCNDKSTLTWLLGTLATDFIKIAIAYKIGMLAVTAFAGVVAIGPLLGVFVIGTVAAFAINEIDEAFSISKSFVAAAEDYFVNSGAFYTAATANSDASLRLFNSIGRGISNSYNDAKNTVDSAYTNVEEKVLDYIFDEMGRFLIRNSHGAFSKYLHRNKYKLVL